MFIYFRVFTLLIIQINTKIITAATNVKGEIKGLIDAFCALKSKCAQYCKPLRTINEMKTMITLTGKN